MAKDSDDVTDNVKQGFGLLWKAARKAASGVRKEVTATAVSKTLEDAGREIARAATNVAEKVGSEFKKIQPKDPKYAEPDDERMKPPYEPPTDDERAQKPKGPTKGDPGFRIATDEKSKKR